MPTNGKIRSRRSMLCSRMQPSVGCNGCRGAHAPGQPQAVPLIRAIEFGCCSACHRPQRDQPTHDELMNNIIGECWLPVVGLEGLYEVSDHGRVRSMDRVIYKHCSGGKRKTLLKGRLLSLIPRDNGSGQRYLVVNIGSQAATFIDSYWKHLLGRAGMAWKPAT